MVDRQCHAKKTVGGMGDLERGTLLSSGWCKHYLRTVGKPGGFYPCQATSSIATMNILIGRAYGEMARPVQEAAGKRLHDMRVTP
jgi:hypothetical protein